MQSDLVMGLFFGPGKFRRGVTDMQVIDDHIRTKETYAAFLVVIYFLLNTLSIAISLVPGAALGGGAAGVTFGALPRTVWTIPGLVISMISIMAIYFDSTTDVAATASWLSAAFWFQGILVLLNLVFLISLVLEVNNVDSTLWAQNGGVWTIVLLIATIFFILWNVWTAWRLFVLRADLATGFECGWYPGVMRTAPSATEPLLPAETYPQREGYGAPPPPRDDNGLTDDYGTAPPVPNEARIRGRVLVSGHKVGVTAVQVNKNK